MTFVARHDTDGPKIRLGVAWFAVSVGACALSPLALAGVLAAAAAMAADQLVRLHGSETPGPSGPLSGKHASLLEDPARLTAVLGAAALPLAASQGADTLAAALAATVVLTMIGTVGQPSMPLLAAFALGLAAASPVLLQRLGTAAGLVVLLLVAAYDAGDFLIGTGGTTSWEGPAAGIAAVAVVGFGAVVVAPPPLQEEGAAALALIVALLAPLGPPVASVLVGDGITPARYVRRLDSLLVAGPIAAYALAAIVPRLA